MNLWLLLTISLGLVGYFAIWSRVKSKARWFAVLAFLVASPVSGGVMFASMGWPVPLYPFVSMPAGKLEVLGVKFIPDVAIYLMLDVGQDDPRTFALPWDPEQASKLQRMMEGAEGEGKIKVELKTNGGTPKGEFSMDAPPQMIPDKPRETQGMVYERQEP